MQMGGNQYGRDMEAGERTGRTLQIVKAAGCPTGTVSGLARVADLEDA